MIVHLYGRVDEEFQPSEGSDEEASDDDEDASDEDIDHSEQQPAMTKKWAISSNNWPMMNSLKMKLITLTTCRQGICQGLSHSSIRAFNVFHSSTSTEGATGFSSCLSQT